MPNTFETNPSRDATDSIRGYVYQIYQSVLAWISLKESEVLILEGAEDFDVHENSAVETVQVKDVSSNLTLRSESIIEALNNFWEHKNKNLTFNIHFRFLTTAQAGQEKGKPFGETKKGLLYWDEVKANKTLVPNLLSFLQTLNLNSDLATFLKSATNEEVYSSLISRIHWDLKNMPREGIEYLLEDKLKIHGMKLQTNSVNSCKALPFLLQKVADLLTLKGHKEIRLSDFYTTFDIATTISLPINQVSLLQKSNDLNNTPSILTPILPIVEGGVYREKLVNKISSVFIEQKVVFLYGSSGMGKSNLAALIARSYNEKWEWANFRGIQREQVKNIIARTSFEIQERSLPPYIVLDDIDFCDFFVFEREIIILIITVVNLNGMIIVTGQTRPPLQLFPKIYVGNDCEFKVPSFDENDIVEMLQNYGVTDSSYLSTCSKAIYVTTWGHPQLVHARIRNLKHQNWPKFKISDLLQTDDVERVKVETSKKLVKELTSEHSRLLIYRVSFLHGSFIRDSAIALAQIPPTISLPGEVFEELVGPWIEQESNNRYRISPLLSGVGKKIFTADETKTIHSTISLDILDRKQIDQYEISSALFHAYLSKNEKALTIVTMGIVQESSEHLNLLSDLVRWFTLLALEESEMIFKENPAIDLMLRLAQFKLLASSTKKEDALTIVTKLEESLKKQNLPDSDQLYASESLVYGTVLNNIDVPLPSNIAIRFLSRLMDISQKSEKLDSILSNITGYSDDSQIIHANPFKILFSLHGHRIDGIAGFRELIDALDTLSSEKRDLLLSPDYEPNMDSLIVNQVWWQEAKNGSLDVDTALKVYQFATKKFTEWNALNYVKACYITMSVITDEYLDKPRESLHILDQGEKFFPKDANFINQRSKVLLNNGNREEGIILAEKALNMGGLPDVEYVFCCRSAGKAAAQLDNWAKASQLFLMGEAKATLSKLQSDMGVGLKADAAYGFWKQNNYKESIKLFIQVLHALENIPLTENIKTHYLHATVRHCITWVCMNTSGTENVDMVEPLPGMCSNQEPHEKITTHNIVDIKGIIVLLEVTARKFGITIDKDEFKGDSGELLSVVDSYQRTSALEYAFEKGEFKHLVKKLFDVQETLFDYNKGNRKESSILSYEKIPSLPENFWESPDNFNYFSTGLLKASIVLTVRCQNIPFNEWKKELHLLEINVSKISELLDALKGKKGESDDLHIEAAISIYKLRQGIWSVEELWDASFIIIKALISDSYWIEEYLNKLFSACWLNAIANHPFDFSNPEKICPELAEICLSKSLNGKAKLALIIGISASHLNKNLSKNTLETLQQLAVKNSS